MNRKSGFSLIELLVVMIIIGIVMTFVVLAFGDFGEERKLYMQQQHLGDLIKLARTRAIIEAETYGLQIAKSRYRFYQFHHQIESPYGEWIQLTDPTFTSNPMPQNKKFFYSQSTNSQSPEIIISPEGEITPFNLSITTYSNAVVILAVDKQSQVSVTSKDK